MHITEVKTHTKVVPFYTFRRLNRRFYKMHKMYNFNILMLRVRDQYIGMMYSYLLTPPLRRRFNHRNM